ncbi:PAAR-like domain-containing protein [Enhygromyxa salina]|nr:PAAR-like domain-containing protein [Enhygromyxa salina]
MALTVFAEQMGFFHKGCGGTGVGPVDVCLSPPPGPVPIPYVNVLFAQDLIKGSKTVRIDGEPTFLEDVSMTSKSIGDEGGTLGGSVVTGEILKNGYFTVWSSTVQVEGLGVARHGDIMGHNSAGGPPPSNLNSGAICQPAQVSAPVPGPVASRRAAEAKVMEATGPGDSEPAKVIPCDFEKISVKCSHTGSGDGKRGFGPFEYTYNGQIQDNLPRPKKGSKAAFIPNIQVIAGEDDRRADKLEIEITGGPGYSCSHSHPHVAVTNRATGEVTKHEGKTKVELKLKCKKIELPAIAYMSPAAVIGYFFFSPKSTNRYIVEVSSCGVLEDQSPGFRKLSRTIDVFSSDKYKLSLSIPALIKRNYANTASKALKPNAKWVDGKDDGWDKKTDWVDDPATPGGAPVRKPIAGVVGASIKLTRNSEDVNATAKLGEIIQAFVNIQNEIQSVMNFIKKFQPQVGWKFGFSIGFFTGDLSFEWAAKEAKDHTVFKWWKFEAALTLVSIELDASFGIDFEVWRFTVTAVVFGKVSGEAKLSASCEATPEKPDWGTQIGVEIKGELGIKAALGADWVAAAGKFELGFPFEASPKIDDKEGLQIDWKLKFNGLEANVVGHIRFAGSFSRKWDIMDKRTLGQGTFPSGEKQATGIPSPEGAIK